MANKMTVQVGMELQTDEFKSGIERSKQVVKDLVAGIEGTTGSIGEMKRAMRELNSISFAGKTKEEIQALNQKIGDLKDSFGDLKSQQAMMGTEMGNMVAKGLQGVAALGEVIVGVASAFGTTKEQAQRYQQVMVTLIGVSQALGTIEDVLTTRLYQNMAARIKQTVVTTAQTVATTAATIATEVWNAVLLANPIGLVVVAVVALTGVIYGLYQMFGKSTSGIDDNSESKLKNIKASNDLRLAEQELSNTLELKTNDKFLNQKIIIDKLVGTIRDSTKSIQDKEKALKELIKLDPTYLDGLNMSNINTKDGITLINQYTEALYKKAKAEAAESLLKDEYIKKIKNEQELEKLNSGIAVDKAKAGKMSNVGTEGWKKLGMTGTFLTEGSIEKDTKRVEELNNQIKESTVLIDKLGKMVISSETTVDFNTSGGKGSGKGGGKGGGENSSEKTKRVDDVKIDNNLKPNGLDPKWYEKQVSLNRMVTESTIKDSNDQADVIAEQAKKKADVQKQLSDSNKTQYELDLQNYRQMLSEKTISEEQFANLQKKIEKDKQNDNLEVIGNSFGQMASLFEENTIAYKLMAITQATISTWLAGAAILANTAKLGPVAMGISFAATIATGLMTVGKIAGAFANGGIVGGQSYNGDQMTARVNSGEMILNATQQANLYSMANQPSNGGGFVKFEIEGSKLVGVLNKQSKKINNTR